MVDHNKSSVLIIDDSRTTLRKMASMLKGVQVYTALSAKLGLEVLAAEEIDLILLDVNMPDIDGFEAAKMISSDERTMNIPIIFITGQDPKQMNKNAAYDIGGMDYLTKPFTEEQVNAKLRLYIRFISREKSMNMELTKANEDLKREISEKNKAEKALLLSKNNLKDTVATKDRFFSIIAHDLKNPIGAYQQLTKMLTEDFMELSLNDIQKVLKQMKVSSKQLIELLENLLTWSRSQTNKIDIEPKIVDLAFIIKNNISLSSSHADKKGIKIFEVVSPGTLAYFDVNTINTVIRNLISNACKFTPEGGKIIVGAVPGKDTTEIYIKDTGVGMSKENLDKLFKLDVHVSTTGTSNEKGTGLGLILCKDFVEKNGGSIRVESKKDEGSKFSFTVLNQAPAS